MRVKHDYRLRYYEISLKIKVSSKSIGWQEGRYYSNGHSNNKKEKPNTVKLNQ